MRQPYERFDVSKVKTEIREGDLWQRGYTSRVVEVLDEGGTKILVRSLETGKVSKITKKFLLQQYRRA